MMWHHGILFNTVKKKKKQLISYFIIILNTKERCSSWVTDYPMPQQYYQWQMCWHKSFYVTCPKWLHVRKSVK